MRVLLISQHFTPELTAATARVHSFAAGLAARGHDVEVLCEVPNHPQGVIEPDFRRRRIVRRELDGFRVTYLWVRPSPEKTTLNRVAFYGSFAASATLAGFSAQRPDVVMASSPPLPAAAAAAAVARRHRVPWVFDVRDIWPEAAVLLGELTNPRLIRAAERLERRLYRSTAAITVTTEPFRAHVSERTDRPEKISVVPNGTTDDWLAVSGLEVDRSELQLPSDLFLWTYAGNLGLAQGLDSAIEAAGLLGEGHRLLLIGDGPMRTRLEAQAAERAPGRVGFHGLVEPAEAARYLRASDAQLVSLGADPGLRGFVPSKLFDCCAVGRPVILAAAGESRRLAEEGEAALGVEPGDPGALAAAVRSLHDDEELRARLSAAGPRLAARYRREDQIENLERVLGSVTA